MTSVLVVHHDLAIADAWTDSLRAAGYEVVQCQGPTGGGAPCPILRGLRCGAVDEADVLLYDELMHGDGERGAEMAAALLAMADGKGLVLASPGMPLDWPGIPAGRVVRISGAPCRGGLTAAVEESLRRAA